MSREYIYAIGSAIFVGMALFSFYAYRFYGYNDMTHKPPKNFIKICVRNTNLSFVAVTSIYASCFMFLAVAGPQFWTKIVLSHPSEIAGGIITVGILLSIVQSRSKGKK